jgi:hypothetical protein
MANARTAPASFDSAVGLPKPPGALTYAWTKTSGGSVTFGTTKAATTTIKGSSTGIYVFKLTVSDGALSAADTVTVTN